jgi:hypothetical protein
MTSERATITVVKLDARGRVAQRHPAAVVAQRPHGVVVQAAWTLPPRASRPRPPRYSTEARKAKKRAPQRSAASMCGPWPEPAKRSISARPPAAR